MKSVKLEGLDEVDIIRAINSKKSLYLRVLLDNLENSIDIDSFNTARKIILDSFNDYSRSIIRLFLGDVEK